MKAHSLYLALALVFFNTDLRAQDIRELSNEEIHAAVSDGRSVPYWDIIQTIEHKNYGQIVDARAFDNGRIFYRVLVMRPNGRLASIVVNARSGRVLSKTSRNANMIQQAARGMPGTENKGTEQSSNAGGNGGGNAGGNGGGNGNGNGGGNGNGNGGGNGNGKH